MKREQVYRLCGKCGIRYEIIKKLKDGFVVECPKCKRNLFFKKTQGVINFTPFFLDILCEYAILDNRKRLLL